MNAIEIEEALSELAERQFEPDDFIFDFLSAFGNKETAIRRLKSKSASDIPGAILQRKKIHIAVCAPGATGDMLTQLRDDPKTARNKCKFIVATDGNLFEVEEVATGEHESRPQDKIDELIGFFLPLAGISSVREIKNNPIDIKATRHLNKLYLELLKDNPDWAAPERRHDLNQFMARLVFCFFAEDTGIFFGGNLFTLTLIKFSDPSGNNLHEIIGELFRAMDTPIEKRAETKFSNWADALPYVNGGLFAGTRDVPRFSRMARATLQAAGSLNWTAINPDIFGSMIQAVADEDERGALGMHYTSVPNIMKVLGPLFLDDLNEQLVTAGDNPRKLLNLRNRLGRIRVFDPACGSGNFLVIAYIRLREIEAKILERRNRAEDDKKSVISLSQFFGIEIKSFPSEIARLALLIAEFQSNVRFIGQAEAILDILPLHQTRNIHCGNALQIDWLSVCPPVMTERATAAEVDLAGPTGKLGLSVVSEPLETYICGNPPYLGSKWQSKEQKEDLKAIFDGRVKSWKSLDYVAGWFMKAADFGQHTDGTAAFVSTNSICQGQQVPILWPTIFASGHHISFAHTSFKWTNLASHNAGVTVAIIAISNMSHQTRRLYSLNTEAEVVMKEVDNINAYLVASNNVAISTLSAPLDDRAKMQFGNHPYYGSALIFSHQEGQELITKYPEANEFVRPLYGAKEFISGSPRACLWVDEHSIDRASAINAIRVKFEKVKKSREAATKDKAAQKLAGTPYRFRDQTTASLHTLAVPRVSSESRPFLPVGLLSGDSIVQDQAFALYDAPLWNMALIASRIHLVWIATVCGKMKTDFRYSNTLGWNTFPLPKLTEKNKTDLTRCAEDILLAREAHFPATIADLYKPDAMPENLRAAHERNDEVLERIYIGRRFRNDTERLEKLFEMYTKMTTKVTAQ